MTRFFGLLVFVVVFSGCAHVEREPRNVAAKKEKLTDVLFGPRPSLDVKGNSLLPQCETLFNQLRALDIRSQTTPERTFQLPPRESCHLEVSIGEQLLDSYQEQCRPFLSTPVSSTKLNWIAEPKCLNALSMLRYLGAWFALQKRDPKETNDIATLIEGINISFMMAENENFSESDVLAERVLQLDPSLAAAAKVSLIASIARVANGIWKGKAASERDWAELDRKWDRLEGLGDRGQELEDSVLWMRTRGFSLERLRTQLQLEERKGKPTVALLYYQSYLGTKDGKHKEARALLEKGKALFPKDDRFERALKTCGGAKKPCEYELRLNYHFDASIWFTQSH